MNNVLSLQVEKLERRLDDTSGEVAELLGTIVKIDARTALMDKTLQKLADDHFELRQELPTIVQNAVAGAKQAARELWDDTSKIEKIEKLTAEKTKLAKALAAYEADKKDDEKDIKKRRRDRIETGIKTAITLAVTFIAGLLANGLYTKLH